MKHTILFFAAAVLLYCAGCQDPYLPSVNTVSNAEEHARIKRIADRRIETDNYLSQILPLHEIRETVTNDGYKRIQLHFKNAAAGACKFQYRFNWYDNAGIEVEDFDNEFWKSKIVAVGDDVVLTSTAPQKNCKDFKLRLKVAY